jgi:hypothetical protein
MNIDGDDDQPGEARGNGRCGPEHQAEERQQGEGAETADKAAARGVHCSTPGRSGTGKGSGRGSGSGSGLGVGVGVGVGVGFGVGRGVATGSGEAAGVGAGTVVGLGSGIDGVATGSAVGALVGAALVAGVGPCDVRTPLASPAASSRTWSESGAGRCSESAA